MDKKVNIVGFIALVALGAISWGVGFAATSRAESAPRCRSGKTDCTPLFQNGAHGVLT